MGGFERNGRSAVHWSVVGDARAPDGGILAWAREHARVLFAHDLDFGAVLASSGAVPPSVIPLRANDVTRQAAGAVMLEALTSFGGELERGALVTVDEDGGRVRVLPLRGA